jgi:hypothetical protein
MSRDEATMRAEDARAMAAGLIGANGYRAGSADGHRAMITTRPTSRRRCSCGCKQRQTHVGLGDGVALMGGCELSVRRWVRDGYRAATSD